MTGQVHETEARSEAEKIRAVLDALGEATLGEVASACLLSGVWSDDELEGFVLRECMRRCQSVLRDKRTGRSR